MPIRFLAVFYLGLQIACQSESSKAPEPAPASPETPPAVASEAAKFICPPGYPAPTASTWQELIAWMEQNEKNYQQAFVDQDLRIIPLDANRARLASAPQRPNIFSLGAPTFEVEPLGGLGRAGGPPVPRAQWKFYLESTNREADFDLVIDSKGRYHYYEPAPKVTETRRVKLCWSPAVEVPYVLASQARCSDSHSYETRSPIPPSTYYWHVPFNVNKMDTLEIAHDTREVILEWSGPPCPAPAIRRDPPEMHDEPT